MAKSKIVMNGRFYIYKITNTVSGREYIGVTHNMGRRMAQHLCSLSRGSHESPQLCEDFKIIGISNFTFSVIMIVEGHRLQAEKKESFYIRKANNPYNASPRTIFNSK